jgi:hypothetical protein
MEKTQWEREEAWFIGVSLMVRLVSPRNSWQGVVGFCFGVCGWGGDGMSTEGV